MNEGQKMASNNAQRLSPSSVLSKYQQYLNSDGSIRACEEAVWFSNMMPKITHSIERCMMLNIIDATASNAPPPIIEKFLNSGGWTTIDSWYQYYLSEKNTSFLIHITKILARLPITIQRLRNVTIAKSVKAASKMPDLQLKQSSKSLIKRWKTLVIESKSSQENKTTFKKISESVTTSNVTKRTKSPEPIDDKIKIVKEASTSNNFIKLLDSVNENRQPITIDTPSEVDLESARQSSTQPPDVGSNAVNLEDDETSFHSEIMEEEFSNLDQTDVVTPNIDSKTKKRKSVSWKPDANLVSVRYFEKDNCSARNNATNGSDNGLSNSDKDSNESGGSLKTWGSLICVDHETDSPVKLFGSSSNEKVLQSKHEEQFLKMIKFEIDLVEPKPSPSEPEGLDLGAGIKPRIHPNITNNAAVGGGIRPMRVPPLNSSNSRFPVPPSPHHNPHPASYTQPNFYAGRGGAAAYPLQYGYLDGGPQVSRPIRPPPPLPQQRVGFRPNRFEPAPVGHRAPYPRPHYPADQGHNYPQFQMDERHQKNYRPAVYNTMMRYANQPPHPRPSSNAYSNENHNRGGGGPPPPHPPPHTQDDPNYRHGMPLAYNQPPPQPGFANQNTSAPHPPNNFKPTYLKTIKCRVHSAGGVCRFGDKCRFIHDDPS